MKKLPKKILPLGTCIAIAAAVIIAVSAGTYAWLEMNVTVKSNDMPYRLLDSHGAGIQTYSIYKRDGIRGAARVRDDQHPDDHIEMTEYDNIFTEKNVDTPIIMRIELDPIPDASDVKWSLTCPDKSISWTTTGTKDGYMLNNLSNIVGVRVAPDDGSVDQYYNEDADLEQTAELYNAAVALLGDGDFLKFARETDTGRKVDRYEHDTKYSEIGDTICLRDLTINDRKLVLYAELIYSPENVDSFIEDYEESASSDEEVIIFPNDMSSMRFEYITCSD